MECQVSLRMHVRRDVVTNSQTQALVFFVFLFLKGKSKTLLVNK